jgi:hypothetical protein
MKRKYGAWFYAGYVFAWAVAIIAGATLAGAILFPVIGKLSGSARGVGELALSGARYLAEWTAKVWALSIGIVLAFNHAYRHRQPASDVPTKPR